MIIADSWKEDDSEIVCPGLSAQTQYSSRPVISYAGPSALTRRDALRGKNPIVFADADEDGWNHAEGCLLAIRLDGTIERFTRASLPRDIKTGEDAPIRVGPESRIQALRDLRK